MREPADGPMNDLAGYRRIALYAALVLALTPASRATGYGGLIAV